MNVKPDGLARHLERPLAPIYLVAGAEPLLVEETLDEIRAAARAQGYDERVVLHADTTFDWQTLRQYQDSMSLFGERRLLDVRLSGGKPGVDGAPALKGYAERPNPDCVLLVQAGELEYRDRKAAWVKSLEKAGVLVDVPKIEPQRLPGWIEARARSRGVALTDGAADLLAERSEGNLLACAQEIDKLALVGEIGTVTAERIFELVSESARFGAFALVNTAIAGDPERALRVLRVLREEGLDAMAVFGPLSWAVRSLARIDEMTRAGAGVQDAVIQAKMFTWRSRHREIQGTLRRVGGRSLTDAVLAIQLAERTAKGALDEAPGANRRVPADPWVVLRAVVLALCGVNNPGLHPYNRV